MIFKGMEIKHSYERVNGEYQWVWSGRFLVDAPGMASMTLNITPELCEKLLHVCADHIVDTAEEVANTLRAKVIEQLAPKMIEKNHDTE